ncbi:uncharacterized protein PGRI_035290 [Penicillium griseofulvum]|uniref:Uncharacterized protein n=1 Tax=Penicillium patulum TaxID=5078 RepID=A0A135LCU1_PENPA|nr:uncharacterized protein PGRI_035290 [Penicillium griseofulvum]KXG46783.1 hypothetical protein PGRI_035290 [Penicillium griseofulvum]
MFNKVLLVAALIGSTLANPVPSDKTKLLNNPKKSKADMKLRHHVPADDACIVEGNFGYHSVEVYATKESMPIDQVCGQGYFDNFRGRCGVISNWGCKFVDENVDRVEEKEKNEDRITGAKMTFSTDVFCSASDIIEAMGAASAADGKKPSGCVKNKGW